VYVILAVPPATPVTMPRLELTVATEVLLLIHDTAGVVALLNVDVVPTHRLVVPVMADGVAFTVTTFVE
jgi:hypothetical protein